MGLFDVLFGGQVNPYTPTPLVSKDTQAQFLQALFAQGMNPQGGFAGMPGYPNPINADRSNTILPNVFNSWQPWNAGTQYIAGQLPTLGQPSPYSQQAQANLNEYGGIGGWPTQLLHSQAQFGGTGGPGHLAMQDIARSGGSGQWGQQLAASAGGYSPASQYLMPFLTGGSAPYRAGWAS